METPTDVALRVMAEKITDLERQNTDLRLTLERSTSNLLPAILGRLRLFQIAFVWAPMSGLGYTKEQTSSMLEKDFGTQLWHECASHTFDLEAIIKDKQQVFAVASAFQSGLGKL